MWTIFIKSKGFYDMRTLGTGPKSELSITGQQLKEVFCAAFSLLCEQSMHTEEISLKEC